MPTYLFKCRDCGEITEIQCSREGVNNPRVCGRGGICGGWMDMLVEKRMQFHVYRERPEVLKWKREKGV